MDTLQGNDDRCWAWCGGAAVADEEGKGSLQGQKRVNITKEKKRYESIDNLENKIDG